MIEEALVVKEEAAQVGLTVVVAGERLVAGCDVD